MKELQGQRKREIASQESAGKKVIKWYGYVMRRNEEYVGKRVMRMDVEKRKTEAEVDGQCQCGLEGEGMSGEDMQNRAVWRQLVRYIELHRSGKRCGRKRR